MTLDESLAILRGGLSSYLDYGAAKPAVAQGDNRPEQTPPVARPTDRDTASGAAKPASFWDNMGPTQYAIAGVGTLVVGTLLFFVFRGVSRI